MHFIYVDDIVEANLAALKAGATNQTYAIVGPSPVTIKLLAELVKEMSPNKVEIEYDLSREDDYLGEVSNTEPSLKELGWQPRIDIHEGLRRYIEWYGEHRHRLNG